MYEQGVCESHWRLVIAIVRQLYPKVSRWLEIEELLAWGIAGLLEAAERYDPTRGATFATFAYHRIRGAIQDGIRETWALPRARRPCAWARCAAGTIPPMPLAPGEEPALPGPYVVTEWDWFTRAAAMLTGAPLESTEMHDPGPTSVAVSDLEGALRSLSEREQHFIYKCYYEGKSVTDAGKELGLSKSWSCRMHARAISRLRDFLGLREQT